MKLFDSYVEVTLNFGSILVLRIELVSYPTFVMVVAYFQGDFIRFKLQCPLRPRLPNQLFNFASNTAVLFQIQRLQLHKIALEDFGTVFCHFTKIVLILLGQQTVTVAVRVFKMAHVEDFDAWVFC